MGSSEIYWIWLSGLREVGLNAKAALLEAYGTAEKAFRAAPGSFHHVDGLTKKDAELLENRNLRGAEEILRRCREKDIRIITFDDPAYPERLRNIYAPPCVLYVKGELPVIDREPLVAIVGTRDASEYGLRMGRKIASEYAECGGTVVSGLTRGIDAAAAEGALEAGGKVVAFLGTSVSDAQNSLARRVMKNGALISEYAPDTPGQKYFFRERNRIGAGISVAVAAIEAPRRSGTVLFVREALEQGKQIFAVPGNADSFLSEGTLQFLRDGAQLITSGREIAREFCNFFPDVLNRKTIDRKEEENSPHEAEEETRGNLSVETEVDPRDIADILSGLTEVQQKIVSAVAEGCGTVEELTLKTGLPTHQILAQVTMLEIKRVLGRNDEKQLVILYS